MTIYVVGAHIGIHTLYIAKRLQTAGKIIALEGWPENYAYLKKNIDLNPRSGVEIIPVQRCVAKESGRVMMAAGSSDGKHHLAAPGDTKTIEVQATSLDDYWRETNLAPDVILMDIEGYEADALEGAQALLQAHKPHLIIEHHRRESLVKAGLAAHGYTSMIVDKRHIFAQ
jgi:FkbM family methyltransferase